MRMLHPAHPDAKNHTRIGMLMRSGANFEPTTIAMVAIAASTAVQAIGAMSSAAAQSQSYKSQAAADDANAEVLKQNAVQARQESSTQEDALRQRQRQIRGQQVASIAQSGIGFSGTGGDLLEQSDIASTLDDLSVRYEGEMKAKGLNQQASQSTYDAAMARANASNATTAGYFGAAGALTQGASSYATWQTKYAPKSNNLSGTSGN